MHDRTSSSALGLGFQAVSIVEFSRLFSICRTKVYAEIRSGRLKAKKHGRRTLILMEEAQRWLHSLQDLTSSEAER